MSSAPHNARGSLMGTVFRAVIGLSLAGWLIRMVMKQNRVDLRVELQTAAPGWLLLALMLYGVALAVSIFRWKLLLDMQDVRLGLGDLARLTMMGVFFSLVIPGTVSGDVIKMVFVSRHAGKRTTEAVLTIMLDRVVGLLGLLAVASVSVLCSLRYLSVAPAEIRTAAYVVGVGSVVGIVGLLAVEWRESLLGLPGVHGLVVFAGRVLPEAVSSIIGRLVNALDIYRTRRRVIGWALLLSMSVHSLLALCSWSLGRGFHEESIDVGQYFLSMQVANCVASVPLTPAGLGGRDFVLSLFYKAAGAAPEKAGMIATSLSLVILFWSLIGGVVFIFSRNPDAPPSTAVPAGAGPSAD